MSFSRDRASERAFPIKGVLAQGLFTFDEEKNLYFGRPLVDAYHLHDEIHFYGIVVHHSAEAKVKDYLNSNPYKKEKIPLKRGSTSHFHFLWYDYDEQLKINPDKRRRDVICGEWLAQIEENVSGAPRIYVDNTRKLIEDSKEPSPPRLKDDQDAPLA